MIVMDVETGPLQRVQDLLRYIQDRSPFCLVLVDICETGDHGYVVWLDHTVVTIDETVHPVLHGFEVSHHLQDVVHKLIRVGHG